MAKKKRIVKRYSGVDIPVSKKIYQSDIVAEPEKTGLNTQQSFRFTVVKREQ